MLAVPRDLGSISVMQFSIEISRGWWCQTLQPLYWRLWANFMTMKDAMEGHHFPLLEVSTAPPSWPEFPGKEQVLDCHWQWSHLYQVSSFPDFQWGQNLIKSVSKLCASEKRHLEQKEAKPWHKDCNLNHACLEVGPIEFCRTYIPEIWLGLHCMRK